MRSWRDGAAAAALAACFASAWGCVGATAQEASPPTLPCGTEVLARGGVSRVIDGRTFALNDGREVRLAAIEVPPLSQQGGRAAKDALAGLLAGAEVVVRQAEAQPTDRYGRLLAYAVAARDGVDRSVQGDLLAAGFGRLGARIAERACAVALLQRENAARMAKLGLWASSYYEALDADNPAKVLAEQGHFALVEGQVVSVHESGATIYVNFGRRWSRDFTVTILKRNARSFAAAGLEPAKLAGRRVRVRGWIEERGGPWIEATRPEQIELADRAN